MLESILIGVVIAIAAIILLIIVIGAIRGLKKNKKEKKEEAIEVEEFPIVAPVVEEEVKPMKIVLAQGEGIVVGSEGRLPCGEYTIETCDNEESVKIRIGRYVKTYENGATIVLTEKQKITPVSASIILR